MLASLLRQRNHTIVMWPLHHQKQRVQVCKSHVHHCEIVTANCNIAQSLVNNIKLKTIHKINTQKFVLAWTKTNMTTVYSKVVGQDSTVGVGTRCGLDSLGGLNPGGGKIFRAHQDWCWDPPNLLYNGQWVLPRGWSGWGVALSTLPQLALRLKKE